MAIPFAPYTFTDGVPNDFNAARANAMSSAIKDAQLMPTARVFNSANINVNTATATALTFNSERWDQFAGSASTQHDTVTNSSRLTALFAGIYLVIGNVQWAANATGLRYASIRLNGTTIYGTQEMAGNATDNVQEVSSLVPMAVNDYVELVVTQTSGAGLNVLAATALSPEFMFVRVG